jgi:hypothetical protein
LAVTDSDNNGQFPADIDSKSRKITMEIALMMIVDGEKKIFGFWWVVYMDGIVMIVDG